MNRILPRLLGGAVGATLLLSAEAAFAQSRRPVTFPSLPRADGGSSSGGGGGSGPLGAFRPFIGFEYEVLRPVNDGTPAPEDARLKGLMISLGGRYTFFIPDVQKIRPFVRGTLRAGAVGKEFSTFSVSGGSGATHYEGILHAGLDLRLGPLSLEPFVGGAYNHFKPKIDGAPGPVDPGSETQLQYGFAATLGIGDSVGLGVNFFWKKGEFQTGQYNRFQIGGNNFAVFWEHRVKATGKIDLPADATAGKQLAVSMPAEDLVGLTIFF